MKLEILSTAIFLVLMFTVIPANAQEPVDTLGCESGDIDRTVLAINSLLEQAQIESEAGDLLASLGRLADVQVFISTLVSQCASRDGSALTVLPRPTICYAGLVFCDLMPQAEGATTVANATDPEARFTANERSAECARSGGYGLLVDGYDFREEQYGYWGIRWEDSPSDSFSVSEFRGLSMWVKGHSDANEQFLIQLTTRQGRNVNVYSEYYVEVSDTEWRQIAIPLTAFASNIDSITGLTLVFDQSAGRGSVCIDDISFLE